MAHGSPATADFPTHLSVEDARARIVAWCAAREHVVQGAFERVPLEQALQRVLAADLVAPHDQPPFANSAMDGYALAATDLPRDGERRLRVVARIFAGDPAGSALAGGECAAIMTGAPLPPGADTVVIREDVRVEGDDVVIPAGARGGAHVRPAGEDFRRGEIALRAGTRLAPAHLGVLAACGQAEVAVARLPRVALFVTGDELVPPAEPLPPGCIHDSNRYSLGGLLRDAGVEPAPVAHLRDDPAVLRAALRDAAARCDLVISSGGVSAGDADHLPRLLAELGETLFWKVRMKPGMPVLCGRIGDALLLALPGNPVSSMATFELFVRPALCALQGAPVAPLDGRFARLDGEVDKRHARAEFLRARADWRGDGACWVTPLARQGSGMLRGMAEADVLIALPEAPCAYARGDTVRILPLPGFAR